jgi:hypothetical protein
MTRQTMSHIIALTVLLIVIAVQWWMGAYQGILP